ncbi:MAG: AIR synthase related protein, partial [Bacteroidota bacterium]
DIVAGHSDYANIMHADTAGTKTSLAYLYWRETGDLSVWEGVVQDAIVMNVDDMACTGCIDDIILSSTVGRNKSLIPAEVISTVIQGSQRFIDRMDELGVRMTLAGGETADVGDIVRTIDVGITAFGRLKRDQVIKNNIAAGDVIVGLASYGKSTYESAYNGGMGSNGLTSARHDLLSHQYAERYPETFDPAITNDLIYSGTRSLEEMIEIEGHGSVSIGKLILSPTRTYLPVLQQVLATHRSDVSGIIHCTGGAQTKVLKFIQNKRVVKDQLLPIPPLFELIEQESGTPRKEMYQVFNMGHRLEVYCRPDAAEKIIDIARSFDIHLLSPEKDEHLLWQLELLSHLKSIGIR